ncbi:PREDICTED: aspartyl protease family protein 2-like [Tarenaya hassleriana]|uniref:aspartyl protease family protein 2-like n=1 Tax=Tarenaya hassleriana TaxID=28532 RepID=UPI00053C6281|nr:PREDICTED: aspartyl protease family protein 2-like [Tarenaya hassleriana]
MNEKIDGLLGLGRGQGLSFPLQTMTQIGSVFSHCLADKKKLSTVDFGRDVIIPGNTLFTPLIDDDSNYRVELAGISVGEKLVSGSYGGGKVIVDSGTTFTTLVESVYKRVWKAFETASPGLKLVNDPMSEYLEHCFTFLGDKKTPGMVLHLPGAGVALSPENCLVSGEKQGTWCFAFKRVDDGSLSIIGNTQLQGIRVVYDLARSRVGFAQNAC